MRTGTLYSWPPLPALIPEPRPYSFLSYAGGVGLGQRKTMSCPEHNRRHPTMGTPCAQSPRRFYPRYPPDPGPFHCQSPRVLFQILPESWRCPNPIPNPITNQGTNPITNIIRAAFPMFLHVFSPARILPPSARILFADGPRVRLSAPSVAIRSRFGPSGAWIRPDQHGGSIGEGEGSKAHRMAAATLRSARFRPCTT